MTRSTPEPAAVATDEGTAPVAIGGAPWWPALRFAMGLLGIVLVVGALAHWARPECELVARGFVRRYGYWGLALGTFLADAFHFPIPPQFYMLLSIASKSSPVASLTVIVAGSVLAGVVGYNAARLVSKNAWIEARTSGFRRLLERAYLRFGVRAALLASVLPIPYSALCYLAGLNRLPTRFLALLCVCRVPKLLLFYWLVQLGWG